MAKRYSYALKSNEGDQIFHSWEECKAAMKGRTGVSYKAFANDTMCQDWLTGKHPVFRPIVEEPGKVTVYTDGSFNPTTPAYGWGFVGILPDGDVYYAFDMGNTPELLPQRNVAGEMIAAMKAVQWAAKEGYKTIELRYDYANVGDWPTGKQNVSDANQYGAIYRDWMRKMGEAITIQYVQIPGHSGDWYNEQADKLARQGSSLGVAVEVAG